MMKLFCSEIFTTHSRVLIHIQGESCKGVGMYFVVLSTIYSETHKNVWVPKTAPLLPVHKFIPIDVHQIGVKSVGD